MKNNKTVVRLHLTNVVGLGASQLLMSLLPAIEAIPTIFVEEMYLPDRGVLSNYICINPGTKISIYRRFLPKILSRLLECLLKVEFFDGKSPILIFGDIPIRCRAKQVVFVQQSNLFRPLKMELSISELNFFVSRLIFKFNESKISAIIVQTVVMRDAVERSFPKLTGRVYVVPQPVPSWLLKSGLNRSSRKFTSGGKLKVIYPAAFYPHKNHNLLFDISADGEWPIEDFVLTLRNDCNPANGLSWVRCVGVLSHDDMIDFYSKVDALVFLSKEESYGFPLIEAMFVGLPIVCPDLPYARCLCGDQALYFNPDDSESLRLALVLLSAKLENGWWPNWENSLCNIPSDWGRVAENMINIVESC